jgi:2-haloacid dehalogenase
MPHPIFVFDAYGTLFDVHSAVGRHAAALGPAAARLSELWRAKQLEYTWVRSLAGAYVDFRACTQAALDYAAADIGGIAAPLHEALLAAYDRLDAHADVAPALAALKARGCRTAILSNGTPDMLAAAVRSAGLGALLDAVLSVDAAGIFKTDPRSYALATSHFGCAADAISFQSSNRWDIAGARKFGFRTVWINRQGRPDEYAELAPDRVMRDLTELTPSP